ncbi:MAG: 4-aminobutyrate--2-oxoglutarate transaminase [Armatimonadetes bacterium]|nr:4-aminobutyrate--2-oxoglutarate transaminase [Armatimonadota bacterium]
MSHIRLVTEIPGPKSKQMLARRLAAMPAGLAKSTEICIERAEGALVHDVDGNTLIDLAGGIGMLNAGHCPPTVVAAVQKQAEKLIHPCALVATYEPYVRLAEVLNEITPGNFPKKTLLANSGSEAVENAVKMARVFTGRSAVICFEGAYHGRTLLTLSLTSKYGLFKKGFGPYAPEIYRLPAPDMYRRPPGMAENDYILWRIHQLEKAFIAQVDPSAVAAIIIEPVQGEAGFIAMPEAFLRRIRELCDQHGIVMIADEVQSGFGRTGKLFAMEHYQIAPDLICMAKSLAAGMPISAVTGRADIVDASHIGGVGGTYGGSPVACAAALETIEIIRQPAFLARAREIGEIIRRTLQGWMQACDLIGDVRGLGAMMLFELVLNRETKEPAAQETLQVIREAVPRGVVLIRAGLYSNCVRLLPPFAITDEQLHEALSILGEAVRTVNARRAVQCG